MYYPNIMLSKRKHLSNYCVFSIDGLVVCKESVPTLMDAWRQEQQEARRRKEEVATTTLRRILIVDHSNNSNYGSKNNRNHRL